MGNLIQNVLSRYNAQKLGKPDLTFSAGQLIVKDPYPGYRCNGFLLPMGVMTYETLENCGCGKDKIHQLALIGIAEEQLQLAPKTEKKQKGGKEGKKKVQVKDRYLDS
ncbi:hypothetical protein Fmac_004398 [Flemingia macrophylla]|uniref:Uncharacterized protein n=1 Tax=Flemingia macrophylla TaxID=520843 RepID=A0ABD1N6A6_9FABA